MKNTLADVYIIESLDPDDEGNGRLEGVFLSHVLRLHGKNPIYQYVRNRQEFKRAVTAFGKSRYRYLHLSCHGAPKGLSTTNLEEIGFDELANMLQPHIKGRRLFVSACEMVHKALAKAIIPQSGCYSVIGPTQKIAFTDSAVVWAAIYHLAFSEDSERMTRTNLLAKLKAACALFDLSFAYFAKSDRYKRGYTDDLLRLSPSGSLHLPGNLHPKLTHT
ncbi:hypothetical protein [Herbaspirillum huttiense]|uniref:hypothetical protein n=1 Tax=Herbaspirillum huttiense TaxID=863372 RepID=UPI0031E02CB5